MKNSKIALIAGVLLSPLLLLLIQGCAKEDSKSNGPKGPDQYDRIEARSESEARFMAMNARTYCGSTNQADCSPSVGMFVSLSSPQGIEQCTAFLVSPHIAMTNSHCLPVELRSAGSACSNRVWLYFPELAGYRKIRVGCSKVLSASPVLDKSKAAPDYAVLLLDEAVNRPPLEISREGLKEGKNYQIVKIDPQGRTSVEGAMTRASCKVVQNSILIPNSINDESPNVALADCDLSRENSGSPVLDASGKVAGLFQFEYEMESLAETVVKTNLPLLDPQIARLNAGTNLACVHLPTDVDAPPKSKECSGTADKRASADEQAKALNVRLEKDLQDELTRIAGTLPTAFQWTLTDYDNPALPAPRSKSYRQNRIAIPFCIRDAAMLLDKRRSWFGTYDSSAELSLTLPVLTVRAGMNRYFVPEYRVSGANDESSRVVPASLTYSPKELAKSNKTPISILQSGSFGQNRVLLTQSIGLCQTK